MRCVAASVVVGLLVAVMAVLTPHGGPDQPISAAARAVGCRSALLVTRTGEPEVEILASGCPGAVQGEPSCPSEAELMTIGQAAWMHASRGFARVQLTLYPDTVAGRTTRPCSRLFTASQLRERWGPRPELRSGASFDVVLWLVWPAGVLGIFMILFQAARSGRLTVVWLMR